MQTSLQVHPSEELLEEYAFGRLMGARLEALEEHLLLCGDCQAGLAQADDFIRLIKAGSQELIADPPRWLAWERCYRRAAPRAIVSAALAAACIAGMVYIKPAASVPATPVVLVSMRGSDGPAHGPAHRPLEFAVSESLATGTYRLEMVTDTGRVVWVSEATARDGKLEAPASRSFARGLYWVRIYDGSGLLREFGLQLE